MPTPDFDRADLVRLREALEELRKRVLEDERIDEDVRRRRADDLGRLWGKVADRLGERPPE